MKLDDFNDTTQFEFTAEHSRFTSDGSVQRDYTAVATRDVYRVWPSEKKYKFAPADRTGVPVFGEEWLPLD